MDSLDVTGLGKVVLFDPLITSLNNVTTAALAMYPNPAENVIVLNENSLSGNTTVRIMDVTGKLVENVSINATKAPMMISVQNLSSGLYFVSVENNGRVFSTKFSKK